MRHKDLEGIQFLGGAGMDEIIRLFAFFTANDAGGSHSTGL